MCVSVYRRSEMGLSGCKVHSADAVAQDFDEGRAPSASESNLEGCLPKGIRQRHDSSRDSAGEGDQMYRSMAVVVASSGSRSGEQQFMEQRRTRAGSVCSF